MTPVVLAYLEGDDVAGVPVTRCAGCRCVLVTGPTCPACTPPVATGRPLSDLRRAWLCLRGLGRAARPAEVAKRLGCSPSALGPQLHKAATRRQRPRFAHLPGGLYAALRWVPATDPSPTSSKIRGIR